MEQDQSSNLKIWISAGLGLLGVCLIGASFFVTDEPAHIALTSLLQTIMVVSGSICVLLSVIVAFTRNNPNLLP